MIEKILVVDDEEIMRDFLQEALESQGFTVTLAESGEKAFALLQKEAFDLVMTDMKMGKMSGLDLLDKIQTLSPKPIVMVATAFASVENAVEAMKRGAFHYLMKPFSRESLMAHIEKANQYLALLQENVYLRETLPSSTSQAFIAESPKMQAIVQDVAKIAKTSSSVFISGETGTGKEVIAHLLHQQSARHNQPFIKVNCAAIPETLLESEFFGHEKGAFTGAIAKKPGRFELADQGTLFLDELTEIPVWLQAKLLRAIQEGEFYRVGGVKPVHTNIRFISASNRCLQEALQEKILREDLYYRLNVVPLHLPPLREREEDLLPLANHFLLKTAQESHVPVKKLSKTAEKALLQYSWPGTVRELANVMERATVLGKKSVIEPADLYLP